MSNELTPSQVQDILTGIGLSQTAYTLNNVLGILVEHQPLIYLDDLAAMNLPGRSQLQLSLPPGFTVEKIYKTDDGGNFFLAVNQQTQQIQIGVEKRGQATFFRVCGGAHGVATSIRGLRPWPTVRPSPARRKGLAVSRRCEGRRVHDQKAVLQSTGSSLRAYPRATD